ncbi:MAG: penicillin-binding protein 1B [Methylococcaceae bacterium]|nr:penicillin-binding protein 1B [Methylococcaceae bacterium]
MNTNSPSTTEQSPSSVFFKWFKRLFFTALFISLIFLFIYIADLDGQIRTTFKGKRWDLPARIYASPLELYVGHKLSLNEFEDVLQQLHYRLDSSVLSEGSYKKLAANKVEFKTRQFVFDDGEQLSQHLRIEFSKNTISQIIDLKTGEAAPIVRMDPVQIGSFYPKRKEDRILIKLKDAPVFLKQGLFATEDRNFYDHYGISLRGVARAMWANLKAGHLVQGGSTITQQLVKNFYLTSERSLKRKVNEAIMSVLLEVNYEKDEILVGYLNEIYLGQDGASAVHGFGLASQFYFARPLTNLPLHQVAALVALVRGPSYYDLRRHPKRGLKRRNMVLTEMFKQGYITEQQASQAKAKPLEVVPHKRRSVNRYPAFLDLVKRQLEEQYKETDLTTAGLKIFTTLDSQVQNNLEVAVARKIAALEKRPKSKNLETAVLVTRREGGEIVALMGGKKSTEAGFNRALDALRPIGSLIKPAVYLTALMQSDKYTMVTPVSDSAIRLNNGGQTWRPKNYDHKEHGIVPMHKALTYSYNLATVRVGMDAGLEQVATTLKNLGVKRPVDLFPSLLLGASPLTPFEVTQMYQTLADDGFVTELRAIRAVIASDGKALQRYPFILERRVDSAATYIVNTMLQNVMYKGTGRSAYKHISKKLALAGKTGTSNELRDSWFAGFSGDYLSVVWIGRDDNKPTGLSGSTGALQLWIALMKQIAIQPMNLIAPDNIEMAWIDGNGLRADSYCRGAKQYPFITGSAPVQLSPCIKSIPITPPPSNKRLDKDGQVLMQPQYQPELQAQPKAKPESTWFDDLFSD